MKPSKSLLIAATLSLIGLTACNTYATSGAQNAVAADAISSPKLKSGTFSGRNDHVTLGAASIVGTAGNYTLVFENDFSLDGAPDPIVGFGSNGNYIAASKLGALTKKTGAQTYQLPVDFTPTKYSEVYVWCEKFDVALGVADLASVKASKSQKSTKSYGS